MEKLGRILHLLLQILLLVLIVHFLGFGGHTLIFGAELATKFGVIVMGITGAVMSFVIPSNRYRILRDTQFGITGYLAKLGFILAIMMLLVNTAAGSANVLIHNEKIFDILSMAFLMLAALSPMSAIGNMFSTIKSLEYRKPKELLRQYYRRPKSR